jgi:hypothetical protein
MTTHNGSYLFKPVEKKSQDRKVWGIGLSVYWLPFFTASNAAGETNLPPDVLGAPLRVRRDKNTNEPRIGSNGRPSFMVAEPLRLQIQKAQDNVIATLVDYTREKQELHPAEYASQVQMAAEAGAPIMVKDVADINDAFAKLAEHEAVDQGAAERASRQPLRVLKAKRQRTPKAAAPAAAAA